jgi:hypothetical protein
MARLVPTRRRCRVEYCNKNALVELIDCRNESRGYFCRRHGDAELKALNAAEMGSDTPVKLDVCDMCDAIATSVSNGHGNYCYRHWSEKHGQRRNPDEP